MNNASVAVFVADVAGPAAYDLYGIVAARSPYWTDIGICWIAASLVLHTLARHFLKGLTP